MSIHSLVLETPTRRIVVDTGLGNDKEGRKVPTWNNRKDPFLETMTAAGFAPDSIDTVLCTHLHVDHVGWNTKLVGDEWVPTFANARYVFGKTEFEHWRDHRDESDKIAVFNDSVKPIADAGKADLVASDARLSDEITLIPTPGHSPGHMSIHIRSDGEEGLLTGDVAHHPCQMAHLDWSSTADSDPKQSAVTRRELFGPAGMHSVVSMNPHTVIPGRVSPYTLDSGGQLLRDTRLGMDYGPLYTDLGMTVADFARWLMALDGRPPMTPKTVAAMSAPSRLRDGTVAAEVFSWTRYGLGLGIDDILGERILAHSGHSGVGFVKFPERGLAVVVFTNLANSAGSDALGLALGVAGMLEWRVALRDLPAVPLPDEKLAARLRLDYERYAAGTPDPKRYAPAIRATVLTNTGDFSGRIHNLGTLKAFEFLREQRLDDERSLWFRARYADATFYVRFSINSEGLVTRLGWWHL